MIPYQYQVIRYRHNQVSEEFVNLGIVLYAFQEKELKVLVTSKYRRISDFFTHVQGASLIAVLKDFEKQLKHISNAPEQLSCLASLQEITSSVFPIDDLSFFCSQVKAGIDVDSETALHNLYEQFIGRYEKEHASQNDDAYAWKTVYKKHFDELGLTKHLTTHVFKTKQDQITFENTWKNGHWNCYKGVSFDLTKEETIKNKIYKWAGLLDELGTLPEEIEVCLLSLFPSENRLSAEKQKNLEHLIEAKLMNKEAGKAKIRIIRESEAQSFAKEISEEMKKLQLIQ